MNTNDGPDPVELDFLEARAHAVSLAAYLDRVDRKGGGGDFRHLALLGVLPLLADPACAGRRARAILEALSDPSREPLAAAPGQGAFGAPPPVA